MLYQDTTRQAIGIVQTEKGEQTMRDKQIEEMAEVLKGMDRLDEARFGFYESYA